MNNIELYFTKHCFHAIVELTARNLETNIEELEKGSFASFADTLIDQIGKAKEGHAAQQLQLQRIQQPITEIIPADNKGRKR